MEETIVMESKPVESKPEEENAELKRMYKKENDQISISNKLRKYSICKKLDSIDNAATLDLWRQRFKQKYPLGIIPKKKFLEVYGDFFGDDLNYTAMTCEVFKSYSSGFESLSFQEFMDALIEASPEDIGPTVLALRMFDFSCDGKIRSDYIHKFLTCHYVRKGQNVETAKVLGAMVTKRIYKSIDKDINEVVPLDVFIQTALSDKSHLTSSQKLELQSDLTTIHWSTAAVLAIANKMRNRFSVMLVNLGVSEEPTRNRETTSVDGEFKEMECEQAYISRPNSVESRDSGVIIETRLTQNKDLEKQQEVMEDNVDDAQSSDENDGEDGNAAKNLSRKRIGNDVLVDETPSKKNKNGGAVLEKPIKEEEPAKVIASENKSHEIQEKKDAEKDETKIKIEPTQI